MRRLALVVVLLLTAGCISIGGGRTDEEIAADGLVELEWLSEHPFADAIDIADWTVARDRTSEAGRANNDDGQLFGSIGVTPTSVTWWYALNDGSVPSGALDAAVAELESQGASLLSTVGESRTLQVETEQYRLWIKLRLADRVNGQVMHVVEVAGG